MSPRQAYLRSVSGPCALQAPGERDPTLVVRADELNVNVSRSLMRLLDSEQLLSTLTADAARQPTASPYADTDATLAPGKVVKLINSCGVLLRASMLTTHQSALSRQPDSSTAWQ